MHSAEEAGAYYEYGAIPRPEQAVVMYDTNEFVISMKKLIIDIEAQMFRDRGLVAEALAKRYERNLKKWENREKTRQEQDDDADDGEDHHAAA